MVFSETDSERNRWIADKRLDEDTWNYSTERFNTGINSIKYYDFTYYDAIDLIEHPLSEFQGMKLKDLFEIFKYYQHELTEGDH